MEIRFKDKQLRELCEKKKAVAVKKLGDVCTRKLHARLADLSAASRVTELLAGNPHPLKGNRFWSICIGLGGRLAPGFAPANEPVPRRSDASIDWAAVTIVCIEYIGDYHD
ncbi:MAG: killer suppression protein HigA [Betaproteobacteria bacterium]|nr:killer suppression protein HigA [Betaproteobacteria bacterium]